MAPVMLHARVLGVVWGVGYSPVYGAFGGGISWAFDGGFHAMPPSLEPSQPLGFMDFEIHFAKELSDLLASLEKACPKSSQQIACPPIGEGYGR
jgi:hypothetical protein